MRTGGVAVAAAVFALVAVYLVDDFEAEPAEPSMREVAIDVGQRARVTLRDGTQVRLNAESRLTLPARFAEGECVVYLEGKSFFEVFPDEDRPFVIKADGAATEVLGTKLNVGAYPDEPDVTVVVSEGKVAVPPDRDPGDGVVMLERHQLAQVSRHEERVVRREVDAARYLPWTQGRRIFHDAPIEEVARRLRRWFGLPVDMDPAIQRVDRLNASFDDESVDVRAYHHVAEDAGEVVVCEERPVRRVVLDAWLPAGEQAMVPATAPAVF